MNKEKRGRIRWELRKRKEKVLWGAALVEKKKRKRKESFMGAALVEKKKRKRKERFRGGGTSGEKEKKKQRRNGSWKEKKGEKIPTFCQLSV